jgi:hypothetical protein
MVGAERVKVTAAQHGALTALWGPEFHVPAHFGSALY